MSPALIALLPFIGALLPGLLIRSGRTVAAAACGTTTFVALLGLLLHISGVPTTSTRSGSLQFCPPGGASKSGCLPL